MHILTSLPLVAALLVPFAAGPGGSDALKAIVASYLEIQVALAADKTDGIGAAARAIEVQAAGMGGEGAPIAAAAKAIEGAADLAAARAAFGTLSDLVVAAARAHGLKDLPGVKVAYCPMVKKSWLQQDGAIRNPFYGSSMLTCGEFTK